MNQLFDYCQRTNQIKLLLESICWPISLFTHDTKDENDKWMLHFKFANQVDYWNRIVRLFSLFIVKVCVKLNNFISSLLFPFVAKVQKTTRLIWCWLCLSVEFCPFQEKKKTENRKREWHQHWNLFLCVCRFLLPFVYFISSLPKCVWSESERKKFHCKNSNVRTQRRLDIRQQVIVWHVTLKIAQ